MLALEGKGVARESPRTGVRVVAAKNAVSVAATIAETPPPNPLWDEHPDYHSYSYGLIGLFVNLVLHAPTSFRGASGALALFAPYAGLGEVQTPSPNCGSNWLLRIGLHEMTRLLERADDWVWIVDHTIQIGTVKCLLIVGCRLSVWQQLDGPLTHQDLSIVALEPAESSKSDIVASEFEKASRRTGVPRAILSDGARDLKRAIEDFRLTHVGTSNLYDIKHKIALLLKHELEGDPCWQEFVRRAGAARSQLMHDPLVYLSPPTLKHKARYMNLGELVAWAVKIRRFLDAPIPPDGQDINIGKMNITLGWLRQYDDSVVGWDCLLQTAEIALEYLRTAGYHAGAAKELRALLAPMAATPPASKMADSLVEFVSAESAKAKPGERLPASSEVVESLIGKGKRLEGQQSRSGFTKTVLAMAAAVTKPTQELIRQAFKTVKTCDVTNWARDKLGVSLQAQRRAAFRTPNQGTKPA